MRIGNVVGILFCFLFLSVHGCAQRGVYDSSLASSIRQEQASPAGQARQNEPAAPDAARTGQTAAPAVQLAVVEPRKVVYTGVFKVLTGDVQSSLSAVKALAEKLGGYMQQMTSDSITVRVPAGEFQQAVEAMEKIGTVTERNILAQDVTERYTDLQIRLKSAKALLEKLRALLDKAQTTKDALEVEREIARVTAEIEQLEAQINRLGGQIAFATLSVTFVPSASAPEELKLRLPFAWLGELGLETLLSFPHHAR